MFWPLPFSSWVTTLVTFAIWAIPDSIEDLAPDFDFEVDFQENHDNNPAPYVKLCYSAHSLFLYMH